jgi:hypothetical protein
MKYEQLLRLKPFEVYHYKHGFKVLHYRDIQIPNTSQSIRVLWHSLSFSPIKDYNPAHILHMMVRRLCNMKASLKQAATVVVSTAHGHNWT